MVNLLTKKLFFDTDCISAFLWVDNESILAILFPGKVVIPKDVYDELSHPALNHLKGMKSQIDQMVALGQARIESISVGTETYKLYRKLTNHPDPGYKVIGKGEAACLSMAKECDGIIASNNLKDISKYVEDFKLEHLTTGDILKKALEEGYITEIQGNTIWSNMIAKRRKLGYPTFSDYLKNQV